MNQETRDDSVKFIVRQFLHEGLSLVWLLVTIVGFILTVFAIYSWTLKHNPRLLVIAALMLAFAVLDLVPALERVRIARRWLALGGLLSGFFGGLSGHQGALRTAFLAKLGLDAQAFVATGTVAAVIVDAARLSAYGMAFAAGSLDAVLAERGGVALVAAASAAAFAGSFAGTRLLRRVTMRSIRALVGVMLALVALALGTGLV